MKIGIDLRPLQNQNRFRGIGRYLENVLREIAPMAKNHHFIFFVERKSQLPEDVLRLFESYEIHSVAANKIKAVKYVRALARPQVRVIVKRGDVDVFFQADPWLGIPKNVPTVASLHDLIPLFFRIEKESTKLKGIKKYKQMFGETVQGKFYNEMLASYASATAIVALSKSSKNDYLTNIDGSRSNDIFVTPLAGSETAFSKPTPAGRKSVRRKYGLGDNPFLLYVGGVDLRKNIKGLARDFFTLKQKHPDLKMVMIGKEFSLKRDLKTVGWTDELAKHPKEAKDILLPGFVPDDDLGVLYGEAAVFPFPSLYEGFGLPILEAMQLECPVVAYDNSSIPEVAGEAAILVKNGEPLAPAIEKVLTDPVLRAELIAKGKQQTKKFSWHKTAQQIFDVIQRVGNDTKK